MPDSFDSDEIEDSPVLAGSIASIKPPGSDGALALPDYAANIDLHDGVSFTCCMARMAPCGFHDGLHPLYGAAVQNDTTPVSLPKGPPSSPFFFF